MNDELLIFHLYRLRDLVLTAGTQFRCSYGDTQVDAALLLLAYYKDCHTKHN